MAEFPVIAERSSINDATGTGTLTNNRDTGRTLPRDWIVPLGSYALLGGLVSFIGWPADIPRLTDWFNSGISIQPNAAVAAACSGVALLFLAFDYRRMSAVVGIVVGFIGVSALIQYFAPGDFTRLNTALMFGREWGRTGVIAPGRMGPPGATCWSLIGITLVLMALPVQRARRAVPRIALTTLAIAALSMAGYFYGADRLFSLPYVTVIALQTATFIAAVSAGIIAAIPEHAPTRWILDEGATGEVARRAIPLVIFVPFFAGWLRLWGEERGLYDSRFGVAILVLVLIILLLALLSWMLRTISHHESALKNADRMKDEFLAMLAHELRNPMAPILNAVQVLRVSRGTDDTIRATTDMLQRQVGQLVRLTDDLVDVSRISRGRIELVRQQLEVSSILNQAVEAAKPLIDGMNQQLDVQVPKEPLYLDADFTRLTQVVGNMLSNASKYSDRGGRISLVVEQERERTVTIRVRDEGIGIAPEHLPRIFDMFMQGDTSLERSASGLGIGLTLVKTLVEMHGGTVQAHSKGRGHGSEFVVRLPSITPPVTAPSAVNGNGAPDRERRVLIVDDNQDGATSLANVLTLFGHSTRTAHDGLQALAVAEQFRPDLVLLDIGLPGLNGFETCRRIRSQPWGKDITLVAVTGWGQETFRQQSMEAGFDTHVVKPVDSDTLRKLLSD